MFVTSATLALTDTEIIRVACMILLRYGAGAQKVALLRVDDLITDEPAAAENWRRVASSVRVIRARGGAW